MTMEYTDFEAADYLSNEDVMAEYLTAAAEDPDPQVLLMALAEVTKARGVSAVSKKAGLGRESLYKALKMGAHPRFETVFAIMNAWV